MLDGAAVCRVAFCALLGIGRSRLTRTSRSFKGTDMRRFAGRFPEFSCGRLACQQPAFMSSAQFGSADCSSRLRGEGAACASVSSWFTQLYYSAAEPLPHEQRLHV